VGSSTTTAPCRGRAPSPRVATALTTGSPALQTRTTVPLSRSLGSLAGRVAPDLRAPPSSATSSTKRPASVQRWASAPAGRMALLRPRMAGLRRRYPSINGRCAGSQEGGVVTPQSPRGPSHKATLANHGGDLRGSRREQPSVLGALGGRSERQSGHLRQLVTDGFLQPAAAMSAKSAATRWLGMEFPFGFRFSRSDRRGSSGGDVSAPATTRSDGAV
jgi:hypothetical protein